MTFSVLYAVLIVSLVFLVFFFVMVVVKTLYSLVSGVLWLYQRLRNGKPERRR